MLQLIAPAVEFVYFLMAFDLGCAVSGINGSYIVYFAHRAPTLYK